MPRTVREVSESKHAVKAMRVVVVECRLYRPSTCTFGTKYCSCRFRLFWI